MDRKILKGVEEQKNKFKKLYHKKNDMNKEIYIRLLRNLEDDIS